MTAPMRCADDQLDDREGASLAFECYTLAEVFVERNDADRSALTALIEALDRREAEAVVVPALHHFSGVPSARQAIRRYIERETGARVLVMYSGG